MIAEIAHKLRRLPPNPRYAEAMAAAEQLDWAVADFAATPSEANLKVLNGLWAHANRLHIAITAPAVVAPPEPPPMIA